MFDFFKKKKKKTNEEELSVTIFFSTFAVIVEKVETEMKIATENIDILNKAFKKVIEKNGCTVQELEMMESLIKQNDKALDVINLQLNKITDLTKTADEHNYLYKLNNGYYSKETTKICSDILSRAMTLTENLPLFAQLAGRTNDMFDKISDKCGFNK